MSDEIQISINDLFYYYDNKGIKYSTPNSSFAELRADFYKTYKVYVDKY